MYGMVCHTYGKEALTSDEIFGEAAFRRFPIYLSVPSEEENRTTRNKNCALGYGFAGP